MIFNDTLCCPSEVERERAHFRSINSPEMAGTWDSQTILVTLGAIGMEWSVTWDGGEKVSVLPLLSRGYLFIIFLTFLRAVMGDEVKRY